MVVLISIINHDLNSILCHDHIDLFDQGLWKIIEASGSNDLLIVHQNVIETCSLKLIGLRTNFVGPSQDDRTVFNCN